MDCTCLLLAMPLLAFGSSFGSITFDSSSTVESMDIGWLEFASCAEGSNPLTYSPEYTFAELLDLAQYAVTVQIGTSTFAPGQITVPDLTVFDYTNTAKICSMPIFALNSGYVLWFGFQYFYIFILVVWNTDTNCL